MSAPTTKDDQQARDALAYIRETMETASSFTAISGWGLILVGLLALAATTLAGARGEPAGLLIWLPTAALAVGASASATAMKARRLKLPLWSGSFRKLAWVMTPSLVAGAMITAVLADRGLNVMLPGTWLSLYGAAITAGGTYSAREFRLMGIAFLLFGAVALFSPAMDLWLMAGGFGGLHILFGFLIAKNYGG